MGLPAQRLYWLMFGGYLHDLGKTRIPDEILFKAGVLTSEEVSVMKQHPVLGAGMVRDVYAATEITPIIVQHHERVDGSGYPTGLRTDASARESQIVAVVDSFDAITTDRPYHQGESREAAVKELFRCSGTLYRPDVVEAFCETPWAQSPQ